MYSYAHKLFVSLCLFAFLLVCGCDWFSSDAGRDQSVGARNEYPESLLRADLRPADVLISLNGEPITVAEFERYSRFNDRVYRLKKRLPLTGANQEAEAAWKQSGNTFFMYLLRRHQLRQAVARAGVVADQESVAKQERVFLEGIGQPSSTVKAVSKKLGPDYGAYLRESITEDASVECLLRQVSTNSLTVVTDEELAQRKREVEQIVSELTVSNRLTRVRAAEAREKILKGELTFPEAGKKYGELAVEQSSFWDVVELAEFPASSPLAQWLAHAEFGDISEPLEMDDGLGIVGVLSKETGPSAELEGKDVDFYQLVRILFKWYDPPEIIDDDDEIREVMLQGRRQMALQALFENLKKTDKIEFPSGGDIFRNKPNEPAKKPKGKAKPKKSKAKSAANKTKKEKSDEKK